MAEVKELVRGGAAVALSDEIEVAETAASTQTVSPQAVGTQFVTRFPRRDRSLESTQQSLNWTVPHPAPGCMALKTAPELEQLWEQQGGAIAHLPQVDFNASMVLAVFAGEGFFREVPSIERVKVLADEVVVYISRFSRPWSTHNAKAVVQVPQSDLPVRFVYLS